MTVEEIKQNTTMADVLSMYGIKVKKGMACCPIHTEKHPSMQVFKDGYKCYACGSYGDIFKFIQEMEGCSFKDAFIKLGGTYKEYKNEKRKKLINKKFERNKAEREQQNIFEERLHSMLCKAITKCRATIRTADPYSEEWCKCINAIDWLEYVLEEKYIKEGGEVNRADVIRMCRRFE